MLQPRLFFFRFQVESGTGEMNSVEKILAVSTICTLFCNVYCNDWTEVLLS